jgi:hypothetical protein
MRKVLVILFVSLFLFSSAAIAADYRVTKSWMKVGESAYSIFEVSPETFIKIDQGRCTVWARVTYKKYPDNKEHIKFISSYGANKSLCFDTVKTDMGSTYKYSPPRCLDITKKHSMAEEIWISIAVIYAAEEAKNIQK